KAEPSQTQKVGKIDLNTDEIYNFTFDSKNKKKSTIYELISKKNNKIIIEAFEPTNYKEFTNNQINFEEIKQVAAGHCNSKIYNWDLKHKYGINLNGTFYPDRVKSITYTFKCPKINQTQIAKAEPSQTQKLDDKDKIKLILCKDNVKLKKYYPFFKDEWIDGQCPKSTPVKISYEEYKLSKQTICLREKQGKNTPAYLMPYDNVDCSGSIDHLVEINFDGKDFYLKKNKLTKQLKITKAEPSQTQKVAKKGILLQSLSDKTSFIESEYLKWKKQKKGWKIYKVIHLDTNKIYEGSGNSDSRTGYIIGKESAFLLCSYSLEGQRNPDGCQNYDYHKQKKIKTVNKEPIIKPKKKVKVAKVEEPKQEEFKPKKTNQDNEAPVITIAEAITVYDASYEIEGEVSDNSKNIFITIDGRIIPVNEGKFRIKRFSPVDEQIEIIATDQWGNRSQPKLVNITIDQQETIVADIFENLNPSKIKTRSDKNRVALIIGIEKYDQTPEASYANLDAKYFYEYVRKGFGVSKANIKLLVDEDANLIQSLGTLNKWLPGKIKDGKTELIIFFAGHGLASSDGKELYLLPQDSDPDLLARTALSRTELFQQIIALNPKSVTMFLDTCYSGISRDEKTLLAFARPVRIVADEQDTPNNFTIFSASQLDQISSGLKEAKHGIFSYYLMKGLEGKADTNQDKQITNGELLAYMDENVSQKASELGREQNPSLAGDPDKILMSYR
ncbi:caspase family protein, partial [Candidatus Pelagibacter sp.]|nr:caspase family protein [Candidatus Pelagibacter sp.]